MRTRTFGRRGWQVTEVGLGAWALGGVGYGKVDPEESAAAVEAYLEAGGNFIDTARVYGESEEIIGRVLSRYPRREQVFVASKTMALETAEIRKDLDDSLRLLRRDSLDLYYLHMPPDDPDDMKRVLDAFLELRSQGRIRAIGASIRGAVVGPETVALCRRYIDSGAVDALQVIYSVMRQDNREMFSEAQRAGVAIVARTVLESGFLTGKFGGDARFDPEDQRHRWNEKIDRIVAAARDFSERVTDAPYQGPAELAMAFALAPAQVSTIIPGGKTAAHVRANVAVAERPPMPVALHAELCRAFAGTTELFNPVRR